MRWQPHVTVAAIIERDDKFLLVEENINDQLLFNQPAGHWEDDETLIEAVKREVLEETAWHFTPNSLVGIYQWRVPISQSQNQSNSQDKQKAPATYLRFAFTGTVDHFEKDRKLDTPIVKTVWHDYASLLKTRKQHRSPQLLLCVDDYLLGKRFPLDCLTLVN